MNGSRAGSLPTYVVPPGPQGAQFHANRAPCWQSRAISSSLGGCKRYLVASPGPQWNSRSRLLSTASNSITATTILAITFTNRGVEAHEKVIAIGRGRVDYSTVRDFGLRRRHADHLLSRYVAHHFCTGLCSHALGCSVFRRSHFPGSVGSIIAADSSRRTSSAACCTA